MIERFKFRAWDTVGFTDADGVWHEGYCVGFYAYTKPAPKGKKDGGGIRIHTYDVTAEGGYRYRVDEDDLELVQGYEDRAAELLEPGELPEYFGRGQKETSERERIRKETSDLGLGDLKITTRAYHTLGRAGCRTAWDVILLARDAEELASLDGCGKRTLHDILDCLDSMFPGWDNRWEVQKNETL